MVSTKDGTGIYFLSATITSPTLARQWKAVQAAYPKATLVQYDPAIAGTFLAKGYNVQYDLSTADVIVSLDADFLSGASYPGFHKLVADYAKRRKDPANGMNRLYSIESTPTTTGMKAEHRLGLRASEIPAFAAALAAAVGASGAAAPQYSWTDEQTKFLTALAKDLKASNGKSAVIPGLYQDESVAALALAINQALGNVGKTVTVSAEPIDPAAQRSERRLQEARCRSQRRQGRLARHSELQPGLLTLLWISASPTPSPRPRSLRISARITTRPASFRTGTFPRLTTSSPGPMPAPTTAQSRSCSR